MASRLGTAIDLKNIGLAKLVFDLRQDLDLYCLLSANWTEINDQFGVAGLFPQIRRRVLGGIILGLCKAYEVEGHMYSLNSIDGIMQQLKNDNLEPFDDSALRDFVNASPGKTLPVDALDVTINSFKTQYRAELEKFKQARDKVIAHSEFLALIDTVPSYDVMEKLFLFVSKFYEAISTAFWGINPDDIPNNRPAYVDLVRLLEILGIENVKTDLQ